MMNLTKAEIRKSLKPKSPVSRAFEGPKFAKAEIRNAKLENRQRQSPWPVLLAPQEPSTTDLMDAGRRNRSRPRREPALADHKGQKKSPGRHWIRLGQRQGARDYFRPGRASLSARTHSGSERFQPERAIAEPRATPSA